MSIILGYPGIGKSTLGGTDKYIDLDSSLFKFELINKDWKRNYNYEDWVTLYINVAMSLSEQGYKVLVSTHGAVQKVLTEMNLSDMILIVPSVELKDEWIEKLHERYLITQSTANFRAWQRAREHYEEDITSLIEDVPPGTMVLEIEGMDYDLSDMLYNI